MTWGYVIGTLLLNVLANLFLKHGMTSLSGGGALLHMLRTPSIYIGAICYGGAFVTYSLALTKLPLGVVYPLITGGIAVTLAVVSIALFGESLRMTQAVGIAMVVAGIWFLSR
jgi:multidrug transporter EmrE-like cation transporter